MTIVTCRELARTQEKDHGTKNIWMQSCLMSTPTHAHQSSHPDPVAAEADLAWVGAADAAHLDHGGREAAPEPARVVLPLPHLARGARRGERGVGLEHGAVGEHVGEVACVERVRAAGVEGHGVAGVVPALAPQAVPERGVHALVLVARQPVVEGAAVRDAQRVRAQEEDHVVQRQALAVEVLRELVHAPLVRRREVAGHARPRHRAVLPPAGDGVPNTTALCMLVSFH